MKPRTWEPDKWFYDWFEVEDGIRYRPKHGRGYILARYPRSDVFACVACGGIFGVQWRRPFERYEIHRGHVQWVVEPPGYCCPWCEAKEIKHANKLRKIAETRAFIRQATEALKNGKRKNFKEDRHDRETA